MFVERDDRSGGTRIGIFVEDHGGFIRSSLATQQPLRDECVHPEVGLVKPETSDLGDRNTEIVEMLADMIGHHGADLSEYAAAVLSEEEFEGIPFAILAGIQIAGVISNIIRKFRREAGSQHLPPFACLVPIDTLIALQNDGRAGIAEDEVKLPESEIGVTGSDFGIQDEDTSRTPRTKRVDGILDCKGRRGTSDVHVVGVTASAEGVLYLDDPLGKALWDKAHTMKKAGGERSLGFSIEGKVPKIGGRKGNKILKAKVHSVAISPVPKNPLTWWEPLAAWGKARFD